MARLSDPGTQAGPATSDTLRELLFKQATLVEKMPFHNPAFKVSILYDDG